MGRFYGFKLHLVCNDRGELLSFCLTPANVDDRDPKTLETLTKNLFGKLFGDKGYISKSLFEMLFNSGVHIVTGIKSNMKNRPMSFHDRILLRKRSVIETMNDELKNICEVEHSRHRAVHNFIMNPISALAAYCFFDKNLPFSFIWRNQTDNSNSFTDKHFMIFFVSRISIHIRLNSYALPKTPFSTPAYAELRFL
jgi:hypothetical protein